MVNKKREEELKIANRFLETRALLTPQIKAFFGNVILENRSQSMHGYQLLRQVTLVQEQSNIALLDGHLCINFKNVPEELFEKLLYTKGLFGQLLIDFEVEVKIESLKLFSTVDTDTKQERHGRRHKIVDANTGSVLSEVEELFLPQENLKKARNFFLNGTM